MEDNTPATTSTPTGSPTQDKLTAPAVKSAARPKGPNTSPIVVGLVAMVLAGLIIATETMDLRVNWSQVGPGMIVGIGVVMVAIGAIGLLRPHDKV